MKPLVTPALFVALILSFASTAIAQNTSWDPELQLKIKAVGAPRVSPDGKRVVLCDYFSGFELVLPNDASGFDDIWPQKLVAFDLGPREIGESIAYAEDENTVFATTENAHPPLIRVIRKDKK